MFFLTEVSNIVADGLNCLTICGACCFYKVKYAI